MERVRWTCVLFLACLVARCAAVQEAAADSSDRQYDIGAYYYPAWHVDSLSEKLHGKNWTEWELVKAAKPRWPGHAMPKVPLWGYESDDDPTVFAKKIDAAAENGVDIFLFDWYWHQGSGPYLSKGLEEGFLKASNNHKVKFALMWANQPLLDIMPAKHAFRGQSVQILNGTTDMATFQQVADHIVTTYFSHPSYYRVRSCPYLSFYQVITLLGSFENNITRTLSALDYIVQKSKALGVAECVHFNGIDTWMRRSKQAASIIKELGFQSLTSYTWFHNSATFDSFPVTSYEHATQVNAAYWDSANKTYPIKYIPNASASWDPSPRTCPTDVFDDSGYPFGPTFASTPAQWKAALQGAKAFMDRTCDPDWCMLTINAWNEWSESAYIEPDTVDQYARLNAIRDVFGAN